MGDAAALAVEMDVGAREGPPTSDMLVARSVGRNFASGGALMPGAGTYIRRPLRTD